MYYIFLYIHIIRDRSDEDKPPRMDIRDQESQNKDNLGSNLLQAKEEESNYNLEHKYNLMHRISIIDGK